MEYVVPFDTTLVVKKSIREVQITIFEAALLVLAVVFLFLQTWRATVIPMLAVPVSIVGTFAGLYMLCKKAVSSFGPPIVVRSKLAAVLSLMGCRQPHREFSRHSGLAQVHATRDALPGGGREPVSRDGRRDRRRHP